MRGQRFHSNGGRNGTEFVIPNAVRDLNAPGVTVLGDGRFVISWNGLDDMANLSVGVFAQRFKSNGDKDGNKKRLNTTKEYRQDAADLSPVGSSGFIAAWETEQDQINPDNNETVIYGRVFPK